MAGKTEHTVPIFQTRMDEAGAMRWCFPPKLPYFSGEPDLSVEDFTMEVERVLAAYPMEEGRAAYLVYSHLTGTAHREVMLHGIAETNTPEKVINILQGVFGDGRRITTLLSAFYSRDQRPDESVLDYSHVLRGLERTINGKEAEALAADLLRDRFVEGLCHSALKTHLRHLVRRRPEITFFEARNEAIQWLDEEEEEQNGLGARSEYGEQSLQTEVAILEESIKCVQELLELAETQVRGRISFKKRKRGRRKRRRTDKTQSVKETATQRDSNPQNLSSVDLKTQINCSDKMVENPLPDLSGMEDEPQGGQWVLLPTSLRPDIPGPSPVKGGNGQHRRLSMTVAATGSPRPLCTSAGTAVSESHPKGDRHRPAEPDVSLPHMKVPDRVGRRLALIRDRALLDGNCCIPAQIASCG